ncbi:LuxR C-terminal-related transcriptional regulator [Streptomyces sp. NPDC058955]|uniref:helix-turn-helix transcriptional regulator n=1 Tax=unclassified Streptomyces TaxID=2593676 RepID=UPI0036553761
MGQGAPGEEEGHEHGVEELCEGGERAYAKALRDGRIARSDTREAMCLVSLGLLHPDPDRLDEYVPTLPGSALSRSLRELSGALEDVRKRMSAVGGVAERFAGFETREVPPAGVIRVLEGKRRIEAAIAEGAARCVSEHVGFQPGGIRPSSVLERALPLALGMAERGVRMRSLYTHVARHGQGILAYLEQVGALVEVRTLDEVPERLVMFDRTVAFIPASPDRELALEIRNAAVIDYLHGVFERMWRVAVPLRDTLPAVSGADGFTRRERVIAALLAEGHTDAEVAERLGINVRTCRAHIAKLAETLGSSSRVELGVRIARAGLDSPPRLPGPGPESP